MCRLDVYFLKYIWQDSEKKIALKFSEIIILESYEVVNIIKIITHIIARKFTKKIDK